ncbi:MAG TPA: hypothetical protein VMG12_42465 [Polyangiaceae bacterium]|nr:hypothetical protein [Polyangiaceae bacterium]
MSWPTAISVGLSLLAGGGAWACGGDVIGLGTGDAQPSFGDPGQSVRNLNLERNDESDPTLTDDLLEIFFISNRDGGRGRKDVWHAQRFDRTEPFGEPELVGEASSSEDEESVAVSGDGKTLWVGTRRAGGRGGIDIWQTTRTERGGAWSTLAPVDALNTDSDDLPRPPGQGGAVMPIASNRGGGSLIQTFFAKRSGPHQDFASPEPVAELWVQDASMEDGFLTDDGLHLFFRRAGLGQDGALYVAWRTSLDAPFREPVMLELVNSAYDDRDPFVSADRSRFFFASNRRNAVFLDIYATQLYLPTYQ